MRTDAKALTEEIPRVFEERLMRQAGLQGAVRGKKHFTTVPDGATPRPADPVALVVGRGAR